MPDKNLIQKADLLLKEAMLIGRDDGDYARAETLIKEADEVYQSAYANDPEAGFADSLVGMARLAEGLALYNLALNFFKRAYKVAFKIGSPPDYFNINAFGKLNEIGRMKYNLGQVRAALTIRDKLYAWYKKVRGEKQFLYNLGLMRDGLLSIIPDDELFAIALYEEEIALAKMKGSKNELGCLLWNLANYYSNMKDKRAFELLEEAYALNRSVSIKIRIAGESQKFNDYGKAERLLAEAYNEVSPQVNSDSNINSHELDIAKIYEKLGRPVQAMEIYQLLLQRHNHDNNLAHAEARTCSLKTALAKLLLRMKRLAEAKKLCEEVLAITGGSSVAYMAYEVQSIYGDILAEEGNSPAAIFFKKRAINCIQAMRRMHRGRRATLHRHFLVENWEIFQSLYRLLIMQSRFNEAEDVLLMLKMDNLSSFVIRGPIEKMPVVPIQFVGLEKDLNNDYEKTSLVAIKVYERWKELCETNPCSQLGLESNGRHATLNALHGFRDQLTQKRLYIVEKLKLFHVDKKKAPTIARKLRGILGLNGQTLNKEGLAKLFKFKPSGKVAQLIIQRDENSGSLINGRQATCWIITLLIQGERIDRLLYLQNGEMEDLVLRYRKALKMIDEGHLALAKEIYDLLFAPIQRELDAGAPSLILLTLSGIMHNLPFAALHDGRQYLIEKYAFAVVNPLAGDCLSNTSVVQKKIIGFGMTEPSSTDEEGANGKPKSFSSLCTTFELKGIVREEGENQGFISGKRLFDGDFSYAALKKAVEKYSILHISSHFELKPGMEANSYLVLGEKKINGHNKILRVAEFNFPLNGIELLVLAACDTGTAAGKEEQIENFATKMQLLGAKTVLATLWPVADQSTSLLMQEMYGRFARETESKVDSLRLAQLKMIKGDYILELERYFESEEPHISMGMKKITAHAWNNKFKHPYFWGPFILQGSWI